jgi:hypothetical protein
MLGKENWSKRLIGYRSPPFSTPFSPRRGEGLGVRGCPGVKILHSLLYFFDNRRPNPPSIAHHIVPSDTDNAITAGIQEIVSRAIVVLSGFGEVIGPVDFEDQFEFDAAEIGGIRRDGVLAAEFLVADLAVANELPDGAGELVCGRSLGAGEVDGFG